MLRTSPLIRCLHERTTAAEVSPAHACIRSWPSCFAQKTQVRRALLQLLVHFFTWHERRQGL